MNKAKGVPGSLSVLKRLGGSPCVSGLGLRCGWLVGWNSLYESGGCSLFWIVDRGRGPLVQERGGFAQGGIKPYKLSGLVRR